MEIAVWDADKKVKLFSSRLAAGEALVLGRECLGDLKASRLARKVSRAQSMFAPHSAYDLSPFSADDMDTFYLEWSCRVL